MRSPCAEWGGASRWGGWLGGAGNRKIWGQISSRSQIMSQIMAQRVMSNVLVRLLRRQTLAATRSESTGSLTQALLWGWKKNVVKRKVSIQQIWQCLIVGECKKRKSGMERAIGTQSLNFQNSNLPTALQIT